MTLQSGQMLAHYRLSEQIGEGGMGVVWKAEDTKLSRAVAIKVLPSEFAEDPQRLARFEREAKLLAALNHPNIATIHGFDHADGLHFLVLELVDGPSLAQMLKTGPLPVEEALDVCRQVAEGLEAAHEAGVIHRDLKPGNVIVTGDGKAKVLDFGLAKGLEGAAGGDSGPDLSMSPTIAAGTQAGVILGTAPYMSPEQSRGKKLDKRTDIWSFGCLLYECLTGRAAFTGETVTDILSVILQSDPDWSALPDRTPPRVRKLMERCLKKSPRSRLHDIADVRIEIEDLLSGEEEPGPAAVAPTGRGRSGWITAVPWILLVLVAGWVAFTGPGEKGPEARRVEFTVQAPPGLDLREFTVAPDGRSIVMVASNQQGERDLWLRHLSSGEAQPLPGTAGATYPFWSPDSGSIGFFTRGQVHRIDLDTGTGVALAPAANGRGGAWGEDGSIIFAPEGWTGLWRVRAGGGEATEITSLAGDEVTHRFPHFLPGGRRFVYLAQDLGSQSFKAWVGSLDGGERESIPADSDSEVYAPPGHLLTVFSSTLVARPMDWKDLGTGERAASVARGVRSGYPQWGRASFSVSDNGVLAYRTLNPVDVELIWFDRQGRRLEAATPPGEYLLPELSPDGRRVAFERVDPPMSNSSELLIYDFDRKSTTRFASAIAGASGSGVSWTRDGNGLVYIQDRAILRGVMGRAGEPEVLMEAASADQDSLPGWPNQLDLASDGSRLFMSNWDSSTDMDIWALPLEPDGKPEAVIRASGSQVMPRLSPDGRWLAYESDESGTPEVYVMGLEPGDGTWPISSGGGGSPRWSPDGSELFFLAPDTMLMAARRTETERERFDAPEPLFEAPLGPAEDSAPRRLAPRLVAVGEDRFLFSVAPPGSIPQSMTVVLNWSEELESRFAEAE